MSPSKESLLWVREIQVLNWKIETTKKELSKIEGSEIYVWAKKDLIELEAQRQELIRS